MRKLSLLLSLLPLLACPEEPSGPITEDEALAPRMDDSPGDWLSIPYPSNYWRRDDGSPDLIAYPNPQAAEIGMDLIQTVENQTVGFALQPSLYVELPLPAASELLEQHPDRALDPDSPVQVLSLGPERKRYSLRLEHLADEGWLRPEHLVIRPLIGEPLKPRTSYALLLLNNLPLDGGKMLGRKASIQQALSSGTGVHADHLASLKSKLADYNIAPETVALATVFTTDDPGAELRALTGQLDLTGPPTLTRDWDHSAQYDSFAVHSSRYHGLLYMHGDKPYATEGGSFIWQDGLAIPASQEEPMRLQLAKPQGEMPASGWPVVIYLHGTGGDVESFINAGDTSPAGLLAQRGLASIAIEQPIHGLRGTPTTETDLHTFNAFNATSSRNMLRQGALDVLNLIRMIQAGHLDTEDWRLDGDTIIFLGHSQGALVGGLLAAHTDRVDCWVFSGSGGGLTYTLLDRKDPLDVSAMASSLAGAGPLTEGHPITSLLQHAFEATDPLSAAPQWLDREAAYLMTVGFQDEQTPKRAGHALTMAAEFPLLTPVAETPWRHRRDDWQPFGPGPIQENVQRGSRARTAGVSQYPEQDHFTIFSHARSKLGYLDFAQSCAEGAPTLEARD